jgi:hypothetical protein
MNLPPLDNPSASLYYQLLCRERQLLEALTERERFEQVALDQQTTIQRLNEEIEALKKLL